MSSSKKHTSYVLLGLVTMFSLGVLYTWSLFRTPLLAQYPWSEGQLSLTFSLVTAFFSVGSFVGGQLGQRFSYALCCRVSAVLCLLGYGGASILPEDPMKALIMLYLCYGICTGLGIGMGYNAILSGITAWFPERSGTISGILLTAYGLSALITGKVFQEAMAAGASLSVVFRWMGVTMFLVMGIGSLFIRPVPTAQVGAADSNRSLFPKELFKKPSFWRAFFWNMSASCGAMMLLNCAADITVFFGGTATMGMILSVSNGACRSFIGILLDKFKCRVVVPLLAFVMIGSGSIMLLGDRFKSLYLILAGMLIYGVAYGGNIVSNATLVRELYGDESYSINFALVCTSAIPASLISGLMLGVLHPNASAGYGATFTAVVVIAVITACLAMMLRRENTSAHAAEKC